MCTNQSMDNHDFSSRVSDSATLETSSHHHPGMPERRHSSPSSLRLVEKHNQTVKRSREWMLWWYDIGMNHMIIFPMILQSWSWKSSLPENINKSEEKSQCQKQSSLEARSTYYLWWDIVNQEPKCIGMCKECNNKHLHLWLYDAG